MAKTDDIHYSLPHDTANAPILPSKKRKHSVVDESPSKTSKKTGKTKNQPQLSKKKRKQLQKILDRKRKKVETRTVLEKLQHHQIDDAERQLYGSVARIGMKEKDKAHATDGSSLSTQRNSIAGSRRGRRQMRKEVCGTGTGGTYYETDTSSESDVEDEQQSDVIPQLGASSNATASKDCFMDQESDGLNSFNPDIYEVPASPVANDDRNPLKSEFTSVSTSEPRPTILPTVYVPVLRSEEVQAARLKLPILAEEQPIVEAIKDHAVVIICGETGSGKTTQVPQFLYEAGFCKDGRLVGITEPRRVAAISMSKRVAEELNLATSIVSYQIRYEGNTTDNTSIKFMTDGVLLKEIQKDFLLSRYSAIIVDEAHERSMYSDILLGLLSRIVPLRQKRGDHPLKLVIMSATLRVEDFSQRNLFRSGIPPTLQVETRQFPVTIHFNRVTSENYLAAAYRRISDIHKLSSPDKGILVFVSGQREVTTLIRWLRRRFPMKKGEQLEDAPVAENEEDRKVANRLKRMKKKQKKHRLAVKDLPSLDLDAYTIQRDPQSGLATTDAPNTGNDGELDLLESDALDLGIFEDDDEWELDELDLAGGLSNDSKRDDQPLYCLPLYSLLSSDKQKRVFQAPPAGCRLCVVATNVAETSLTIPNIKYVVDTGKEKVRIYDGIAGVSKFVVQWISKASASQRAGRAGRTCAGHCYRLYSSAVFNDFETFSRPEIVNKPVEELVLQMKNMNILKVVNFPFPTSPEREVLKTAEARLLRLGALIEAGGQLKITPLGRTIALFPVKPEFGKMLALGNQYDLLPYVVCLVAILSVREPLNGIGVKKDDQKNLNDPLQIRRSWICGNGRQNQSMLLGDVSVLLRAMIEFDQATGSLVKFCQTCGVRLEAMLEARKMRKQLTDIINRLAPDLGLTMDNQLKPPSDRQSLLLRQVLLAGLAENVAIKVEADSVVTSNESERKMVKKAYRTAKMVDFVYIHPNSVLCKAQPQYVVYQEIVETTRKYMHTVTAVEHGWMQQQQQV